MSGTEIARLIAACRAYLGGLAGDGAAEAVVGFDAEIGPKPLVTPEPPRRVPACRHLDAALAACGDAGLAAAVAAAAPHLRWVTYDAYPPAEIGPAFAAGHAFAELAGPQGAAVATRDYALGVFLIAPRLLYRDHRHPAPELYAPLTGPTWWRFGLGPWQRRDAGETVWNPPGAVHATRVGEVPLLCLYAWTRDVDLPAHVVPAPDWAEIEATL